MLMESSKQAFDLRQLATVVRRRWVWLVVPTILGLAAALAVSLAQPKQYDATVIMLAGQGEGIADVTAIDAITKATQTLARMGTNRVVIEEALDDLRLDDELDAVDVAASVSSSVPVNTQQIEITVRNTDPERAAELANAIGTAFSGMVERSASKESGLSASVWQPALVPGAPSSPNLRLNALLGIVLGLMIGVVLVVLREQLDQGWRGEEELEQLLGVPVLAAIPDASVKTRKARVYA